MNLNNAPAYGSNYEFRASIRPIGSDSTQNINACVKSVTLNNGYVPTVDCNSLPSSLVSSTAISIPINYTADQDRDVVIELWQTNPSQYVDLARTTVGAGAGTATILLNVDTAPIPGSNYLLKVGIRPVGSNWQENIDNCNRFDVTFTDETLSISTNSIDSNNLVVYPNPLRSDKLNISLNNRQIDDTNFTVQIFNISGFLVQEEKINLDIDNRELSINSRVKNSIYFVKISNGIFEEVKKVIINR